MSKVTKDKYELMHMSDQNGEVIVIDGYGDVYLDGKKIAHSDRLEMMAEENIKQMIKEE